MGSNSPAESYRYAAFISYRHTEADRRWAKWLHQKLETYRVPKRLAIEKNLPRRVGRCFRDEEELPASADLSKEIDTALEQSRFLIVVCSPNTPASQWVNQEVLRFRQMGRHERILALLIEGEPKDSFPLALVEIRRTVTDAQGLSREEVEQVEPLAADVRATRTESRGHLGRMARLRLIACVIGVKFDDLRQREQERRNRRLAAVSVFMTVLLCLMGGLALFAFNQRDVAKKEAIRANQATIRAVKGEAEAQQNAKEVRQNANEARLHLAEGLVSQGDTFLLADRWAKGMDVYWEAYRDFAELHSSPFRAEAALAIAHDTLPPPLLTLTGHTDHVTSVAFSPDGHSALSGSDDNTLKLWDLATGREIRTLAGHSSGVESVAFSPDGHSALSGSWDKTLKLWDLATGKEIRTLSGHTGPVNSVAFSPDGHSALSGSDDNTLKLWDLATGREIRTLAGHSSGVESVAFSPDGRSAISGSLDATLKLWDLATGKEIRTLSGHADTVFSVAFSPDGHSALSGSYDRTLKLWDLARGKEIRTLAKYTDAARNVAFSPDGHTALSGSYYGTLKLWNLATGKEIRTLSEDTRATTIEMGEGPYRYERYPKDMLFQVTSVAFSPDGHSALSGSKDKTLKLWDLATGKEIRTLSGHTFWVTSVAFSPDGHSVLSGSGDLTLIFWDFSRTPLYLYFDAKVPQAQATLQKNPDDAAALAVLGEWYAFRGVNHWAVEFLEKARAGGVAVNPLTLAQCYWESSDDLPLGCKLKRADCLAAAAREYSAALAASHDTQEKFHLQLCLDAIQTASTQPAATQPTARIADTQSAIPVADTKPASTEDFLDVCKAGTPKQVMVMINSGADLNAKDKYGMTPLMWAAMSNPNPDVIVALLKAGADVNAKDDHGRTPLMAAAFKNPNPDVIAVLLKAGADLNAKDKDDKTVLDYARKKDNSPAVEALIKAGAQGK